MEIFFRYHQDFSKKEEEKAKFPIWSVGYQNRVKRGCVEFISEEMVGKYSKMEILVLTFLKKVKF